MCPVPCDSGFHDSTTHGRASLSRAFLVPLTRRPRSCDPTEVTPRQGQQATLHQRRPRKPGLKQPAAAATPVSGERLGLVVRAQTCGAASTAFGPEASPAGPGSVSSGRRSRSFRSTVQGEARAETWAPVRLEVGRPGKRSPGACPEMSWKLIKGQGSRGENVRAERAYVPIKTGRLDHQITILKLVALGSPSNTERGHSRRVF